MTAQCTFCQSNQVQHVRQDKLSQSKFNNSQLNNNQAGDRNFYHCQHCDFIFCPQIEHVSLEKEKARYQTHQNRPDDIGYKEFMMKFARPVLSRIENRKIEFALDYGAGEGSPLAGIFAEQKIKVYEYDPYFKNHQHLLEKKYDLVMATEVVEHFRNPAEDFVKMLSLLKHGGILALMTQFHKQSQDPYFFAKWWYPNDFTHIGFFSEKTFHYWAQSKNLKVLYCKDPVFIAEVL